VLVSSTRKDIEAESAIGLDGTVQVGDGDHGVVEAGDHNSRVNADCRAGSTSRVTRSNWPFWS
jgi:hypothetical protein